MFRIETDSHARDTVLRLSGWMQSRHIPELKGEIEGSGRKIILDLGKVTLVDREVVRFLGACAAKGMELRDCPSYIQLWLASEKNSDPSA